MVKQKWLVKTDSGESSVEYSFSVLSGKTTLKVDGDSFTVKGKPFGIGCTRSEMILVGGEQAILNVAKGGKATLICREGEVTELNID
ncbi:MAG: hypothetical protein E7611_09340 [Ruminococcaceae bacterium]|nr:hypothetical protein [Oscillospiraceae bacterium]